MSPDGPDALHALCLACGACCDGTLFTHAELDDDERDRVRTRLRLLPTTNTDRAAFSQPCAAHSSQGCGLYVERPRVCCRYRCDLYKACESGASQIDAAVALVRRIKMVAGRVRDKLGADGTSRSLWQRVAALGAKSGAELAATDPELAMDIAELAMRVKRDLGVAPDGKLPSSTT